jgi:hypothetical protein
MILALPDKIGDKKYQNLLMVLPRFQWNRWSLGWADDARKDVS